MPVGGIVGCNVGVAVAAIPQTQAGWAILGGVLGLCFGAAIGGFLMEITDKS